MSILIRMPNGTVLCCRPPALQVRGARRPLQGLVPRVVAPGAAVRYQLAPHGVHAEARVRPALFLARPCDGVG